MRFRQRIKPGKPPLLLPYGFLISILLIIIFSSGCFGSLEHRDVFREYEEVFLQNIDVMATPQEENALLTVTPYIRNDQDTDSSMLSVKVKIIDEETHLIAAEKDADMGYVKARSLIYNAVPLGTVNPGNYQVEVQLFREGEILDSGSEHITIRVDTSVDQPADILLTDMNLVITQFTDRDAKAVVDISPGVYNQGGDSRPLTMLVTAKKDEYTSYTESDELGIVKGSGQLRGHVRFVLPRRAEYTFAVTVEENGREIITSEITGPVKMDKIERNAVKNYPLVEEGTPIELPAEETPDSEGSTPGFESLFMFIAFLLAAGIIINRGPDNKKNEKEE
ncbi:hypothetical protein DU86_10540 [Methanosarcina mazei]|jgi:hypothetical protein|uniref:DUF7490 domain-containing protein n=3 Tax=Methanosarcina mazei TaxID=2209 RepID=A0A0F8KJ08_METMZ|nr:hypothetical protein MSMAW_2644 [Methanosarcina mazei WWM610]AKB71618.1 hypothetical protein MSMAC_1728 [Methanosarcina mazei C16]KKG08151.1 hypothetical protein DU31_09330 [Methanosarcina mazei]KKG08832.1 hypothetical protein DU34_09390 [Methanosarcina mazei]KKG29401.1 hypothetical protein DU49_00665 [Methanosarcina mazei]